MFLNTDYKKCLCCLPLRRGLLAWGYLKVVFMVMLIISFWTSVFYETFLDQEIYCYVIAILTILAAIDIIFHLLLICGAHLEKYALLTVFNCYNGVLVFIFAGAICTTLFIWIDYLPSVYSPEFALISLVLVISIIVNLALLYLSMLVGSETKRIKQESNGKNKWYYRFNNQPSPVKKV